MSVLPTYLLERTFDAPRELVWRLSLAVYGSTR